MPDDFGAWDIEVERRIARDRASLPMVHIKLAFRPCTPAAPTSELRTCKVCDARAEWCYRLALAIPHQTSTIRMCIAGSECVPNGTVWFSPYGIMGDEPDRDKAYISDRGGGRYLLSDTQWRELVTRYVEGNERMRKRNLVPRGALSLCEHDMAGTLMLYEGP